MFFEDKKYQWRILADKQRQVNSEQFSLSALLKLLAPEFYIYFKKIANLWQ
jgi:hypothetical protein